MCEAMMSCVHMTSSPLLFVPPPWRPVAAPQPNPSHSKLDCSPSEPQLDKGEMTAGRVELSHGDGENRELHQRSSAEVFPPPACQDGEESLAKSLQEFSPVEKPLD